MYRPLGDTHLQVSPVGFGGYRISEDSEWHGAALELALLSGVNLIDTSANYTDGSSEKLIGRVLTRLFKNRQLVRKNVVVVTKAGYIQGQNWDRYLTQLESGNESPDTWRLDQGLAYSIHPDFLADQLTRSLRNLNLDCIDVFLLHNPEYFFQVPMHQQMDFAESRALFLSHIRRAFLYLEQQVNAGQIRYYGISSNHFGYPALSTQGVNLGEIVALANESGAKHFKVIQTPINLLEPDALWLSNQVNELTTVQMAASLGIGVLANRPLNAMEDGRLIRLVTYPNQGGICERESEQWYALISEMKNLERVMIDSISDEPDVLQIKPQLVACLTLVDPILEQLDLIESVERWDSVLHGYYLPRLEYALSVLSKAATDETEIQFKMDAFIQCFQKWVVGLTQYFQNQSNERLHPFLEQVHAHLPSDWHRLDLATTAIRLLVETPGISSVLVGMREEPYVTHVLEAVSRPLSNPDAHVWEAVSQLNLL